METVKILRKLWHRRVSVTVVMALSITLGLVLTHRVGLPPESRQYRVGVAGARILIDTPKSQFIEVAPLGADTLGQRANVLAALMAEGDVKAAIARRAGLAPQDLLAVSESSAEPQAVNPSDLKGPEINLLTTRVVRDSEGGQLPIIEVEAQAPDSAAATRLVNAAVSGVGEYLDSKAAGEQIADRRRLKVSSLGINPGRLEVRGPGLLIGVGVGILAFLFGCAIILGVSALSRGWRDAEADEHGRRDESGPTEAQPPPVRTRAKLEPVGDLEPQAPPRDASWRNPERVVKPVDHAELSETREPDSQMRAAAPPERPRRQRNSLSRTTGSVNAGSKAPGLDTAPAVETARPSDAAAGR